MGFKDAAELWQIFPKAGKLFIWMWERVLIVSMSSITDILPQAPHPPSSGSQQGMGCGILSSAQASLTQWPHFTVYVTFHMHCLLWLFIKFLVGDHTHTFQFEPRFCHLIAKSGPQCPDNTQTVLCRYHTLHTHHTPRQRGKQGRGDHSILARGAPGVVACLMSHKMSAEESTQALGSGFQIHSSPIKNL